MTKAKVTSRSKSRSLWPKYTPGRRCTWRSNWGQHGAQWPLGPLAASVVNIAAASTTVALMLGLSCGIDYGRFVVSRYRSNVFSRKFRGCGEDGL